MRLILLLALAAPAFASAFDLNATELGTVPSGVGNHTYAGTGLSVFSDHGFDSYGYEPWKGLWISSSAYNPMEAVVHSSFTLDVPTTFLEFTFNAMDPGEEIYDLSTNAGTPTFTLSDAVGTAFDGTTITSSAFNGGGRFTVTSSVPFTTFSFTHNGTNNGTVIRSLSAPVPEPASMAVLGLGLAALRRRRAKK